MQIIVSETEGVCSVDGTGEVGDEGLEVGKRAEGADLGKIQGEMRAESNSDEGKVARHINVTVCHASQDRNPRDWIRSGSEQDQSRMGISKWIRAGWEYQTLGLCFLFLGQKFDVWD